MGHTYAKRPGIPAGIAAASAAPTMALPSIPNSAMLSMMGYRDAGGGSDLAAAMQAKISALHRQIPAAESEADRLSAGLTASSVEQVRDEMGARLGADFSSVRFHNDTYSAARAEHMGALAWTRGNDVYFGDGGFTPSVAAHELVHTVQQGVVPGEVSQSVPMGTVQMDPKRPWQMTQKEIKANHFNPGAKSIKKPTDKKSLIDFGINQELQQALTAIDNAVDIPAAYTAFKTGIGATNSKLKFQDASGNRKVLAANDPEIQDIDLDRFKAKLKNMTRMIFDFPELAERLENFVVMDNNDTKVNYAMAAGNLVPLDPALKPMARIHYKPFYDENTPAAIAKRQQIAQNEKNTGFSAADASYDGTHELGHVLNMLFMMKKTNPNSESYDANDWDKHKTADEMLKKVLHKLGKKPDKHYFTHTTGPEAGHVNLKTSKLHEKGITSGYGETDAAEFFAEAFADVYAHGEKARKASKELVKLYEASQFHQNAIAEQRNKQENRIHEAYNTSTPTAEQTQLKDTLNQTAGSGNGKKGEAKVKKILGIP